MNIVEFFKSSATRISDEIRNIREWLHQYPELSFEEKQTSAFIAQKLHEWNIPFKENIGGYGIVAWINGNVAGKNIAIRADIDALPIDENTGLHFSSKNKGKMHACGHDVHTALLLGALKILNNIRDRFSGTIYGIFQPAEEKIPGGAIAMLNDEFFKSIHFNSIIAQHVSPEIPCGFIGIKAGPYMASTDEIYITVKGKGGHAAMPHTINDTVLAASQIIVSLQSIVSRFSNPNIPSVLSFGKFIANGATNVIPDVVFLEGTFRTFDENWRKEALNKIYSISHNIANAMNVDVEIKILNGYPVLINDEKLTTLIEKIAASYLSNTKIIKLDKRTTAEDFSYFSQHFPSVMFRLGTGGDDYCSFPLHSSKFDVNANIFLFAHGLLAYIAYCLTE